MSVAQEFVAKILTDRQSKDGHLVYRVLVVAEDEGDVVQARIFYEMGTTMNPALRPRAASNLAGNISLLIEPIGGYWGLVQPPADGILLHLDDHPGDDVTGPIRQALAARDGWLLIGRLDELEHFSRSPLP